MKIKRTAVGNKQEAFIENGFADGLNIISSDDNNKGKTIAIQSMMYALGNEPAFPTSGLFIIISPDDILHLESSCLTSFPETISFH